MYVRLFSKGALRVLNKTHNISFWSLCFSFCTDRHTDKQRDANNTCCIQQSWKPLSLSVCLFVRLSICLFLVYPTSVHMAMLHAWYKEYILHTYIASVIVTRNHQRYSTSTLLLLLLLLMMMMMNIIRPCTALGPAVRARCGRLLVGAHWLLVAVNHLSHAGWSTAEQARDAVWRVIWRHCASVTSSTW